MPIPVKASPFFEAYLEWWVEAVFVESAYWNHGFQ